ncbi:inorganic phosphate transporter [Chlamydiifrater phoenicopteri]|uniref:inorganic phosphate transporter n=1 Tax=Chlamydiifrater phoenicopteri TaxID=2681469 RepID=UPI001BCC27E4|nr:inorganic phosphate transporter [Chlamydiifrater phoenicopteri]
MFYLLCFIVLCSCYASWNIGANDVANAVGTSVGSGVLTLKQAVVVAAVFELLGAVFLGSRVAGTIEGQIIDLSSYTGNPMEYVFAMTAALLATGVWLQLASFFGWPVSTTHSIIGAVIGSGLSIGKGLFIRWGAVGSIVVGWLVSPILGGSVAYLIFTIIRRTVFYKSDPVRAVIKVAPVMTFVVFSTMSAIILGGSSHVSKVSFFERCGILLGVGVLAFVICFSLLRMKRSQTISSSPVKGSLTDRLKTHGGDYGIKYLLVERVFAYLQIVVAAFMAFAHGSNDVANAIAPLLAVIKIMNPQMYSPLTVSLLMGLGGLLLIIGLATWGWRVIETVGCKITELTPSRGFSAGFGSSLTIALASALGLPVSTTHVVVGAVLGIGVARGIRAINLNIIKDIIMSWFITVPAGALFSVLFFFALRAIFG